MKKPQQVTKAIKNRRHTCEINMYRTFELHRKLTNYASISPTFS